jgi:hypothetical protein
MPAYVDDGFVPAAPVARVSLRHPDSSASIDDVRLSLLRWLPGSLRLPYPAISFHTHASP